MLDREWTTVVKAHIARDPEEKQRVGEDVGEHGAVPDKQQTHVSKETRLADVHRLFQNSLAGLVQSFVLLGPLLFVKEVHPHGLWLVHSARIGTPCHLAQVRQARAQKSLSRGYCNVDGRAVS